MTDTRTDPQTAPHEVQAVLIDVLAGLVGREYAEEMEVGRATRFEADLELESMEVAELAEQLMARYGDRVDFVAWFAEMELEQIIGLSVGDVVDFVVATLGGDDGRPDGTTSGTSAGKGSAGAPGAGAGAPGTPDGTAGPTDPAAGAPASPAEG